MSPSDLPVNERVAAIEPQVERLNADIEDLHIFKDAMVKELNELSGSIRVLSWKVSLITGAAVVFFNQLFDWGLRNLLR